MSYKEREDGRCNAFAVIHILIALLVRGKTGAADRQRTRLGIQNGT